MSESEDAWDENDYCDPYDDDQYARDDDADEWDDDWNNAKENIPESAEERERRFNAQKERVCKNCENYDKHCSISFCKRFWQYEAPLTLMPKDLSEKEGRAKNCEFYKNRYE